MTHFIIPFRAKSPRENWELACSLLRQTLRSIENQSDHEFLVTICGKDEPGFIAGLDERFQFVALPAVGGEDGKESCASGSSSLDDILIKKSYALYRAAPQEEEFVMALDADDLLHSDFLKIVKRYSSQSDVVVCNHGYEMDFRSKKVLARNNMLQKCGSSFVVKAKHLRPPRSVTEVARNRTLYREVWHSNLLKYCNDHEWNVGFPLEKMVIYVVNTSLNHSDRLRSKIRHRIRQRLKFFCGNSCGGAMRREFGMNNGMGNE